MTVYNVLTAVVALVDADTAEEAINYVQSELNNAGFTVYEGGPTDAFESEPTDTLEV